MSSAGAGGKPSRSAIVADTESGHHLLTIHGYSSTKSIPTGECVKSRPFTVGGHVWCIDYYPNGVNSEFAEYVSFRLTLDEDVAAEVKAKWNVSLAGEKEEEAKQVAWASTSVFSFASRVGWRYKNFIKREVLESSTHLRNDSFTVRCDIVVVHGCRAVEEHGAPFVSVPPCDLREHLEELLQSEDGADVVFKVGGDTVAAHSCVLTARSVFCAELFGLVKEGNADHVVVHIQDMDAEVFRALLHFVYTGILPEMWKEEEDVMCQDLLVAADRYEMGRLKLTCEEKLCEYINVSTVGTILALAEQHHCQGLKKACFDFLGSPANLKAVITTDGFQHLSRSCPSLMIQIVAMSLVS